MYIIAEIGFNHEGNMDVAKKMIEEAASAGANAVKFQTFRAIDIALPSSPHFAAIKCGEMTEKQHEKLMKTATDCDIDFLSTPFSIWAVDLLESIGVPAYKVASMDCNNTHLLQYIAKKRKPVYLSTGMACEYDIAVALSCLKSNGAGPVTLMHCISKYPAEAKDLNLEIITYLKFIFNLPVGYSDHYKGTQACLTAAMMGAEVIETHFTLDSKKKGGDHSHSVEPSDLKKLVEDLNFFKIMKGRWNIMLNRPDDKFKKDFRRGIYAAKNIKKGEVLDETNLLLCRPEAELSPQDMEWLLGKTIKKDIPAFSMVTEKHVKKSK